MRVRRAGCLAAAMFLIVVWMACGQVYRPVVIPCSTGGVPGCPVETNPQPSNFHDVFGISTNTASYPGTAMQIDVSGDTVVGETPSNDPSKPNLGGNPTHMAILPNDARVFVASAGSIVPGGIDVVSWFTPQFQSTLATGLSAVNTINMPVGSQPVFLNTAQSAALYVANFGTNSVSQINTTSNVITNTVTVGTNPVSLAETPNAYKLYVANQGDSTVSTLSPIDLSNNTANGLVTGFTGTTPVWVVARGDSQKVYVLTQGDGQLWTIDVATDTVTSNLPVGAGANFVFYDPNLNRIYVTNPVTSTVYVFSAAGGANDTPSLLATLAIPAACAGCGAVFPVSVAALPDGTRFYVASYQTAVTCPAGTGAVGACVVAGLTVFDANSLTVKYPSTPTMSLLSSYGTSFSTGQTAVPAVTACGPVPAAPSTVYSPGVARFRVFTVASEDSSRVYVSMCDAGAIAVINTTGANTNNPGNPLPPDTVVTDLPAAPGACSQATCSNTALITGFSITSNVITFQSANVFAPGQTVTINGFTSDTYLNGLILTVLPTGLSSTQFECDFSHPNVTATTDSGNAVPLPAPQAPIFLITGQ
ncbi:MAG: YncE family protein [Candidatus Sulfotelmatobacter sp.]